VLIAAGALVASLLTMGAYAFDGYLFYEKIAVDETRVTSVTPGQAGTAYGIEWKAELTPAEPPAGGRRDAEVTWLKVDITQKVVDAGSVTMTASPSDVRLQDRAGRTWVVELTPGERPSDRLEVGTVYTFEGMAIVPPKVAEEVELSLRPSTYRSDTPTEDLFKRETVAKLQPDVEVLLFRRR